MIYVQLSEDGRCTGTMPADTPYSTEGFALMGSGPPGDVSDYVWDGSEWAYSEHPDNARMRVEAEEAAERAENVPLLMDAVTEVAGVTAADIADIQDALVEVADLLAELLGGE